jgi:hypothetical protein
MDGKKIVASKNFVSVSADGNTKTKITAALTCVATAKELTFSLRAADAEFDSFIDHLDTLPTGRVKTRNSQPIQLAFFFGIKQDNFLVWPVSFLSSIGTSGGMGLLIEANNPSLLISAEAIGIPGATKYGDVNSMFSGERPWTIEDQPVRTLLRSQFPQIAIA